MAEATYTKVYKDFRGVDFSSERSECDPRRFKDLVNMWKDYRSESGAAVETAPGFRKLLEGSGSKVNGLHFLPAKGDMEAKVIVHQGTGLSSHSIKNDPDGVYFDKIGVTVGIKTGEEYRPYSSAANAISRSLLCGDSLYVVDGKQYYRIKHGSTKSIAELAGDDTAYVPTTFINGEPYEQRNLLTDKYMEKFKYSPDSIMYLHERVEWIDHLYVVSGGNKTERFPFKVVTPDDNSSYYHLDETGIVFSPDLSADTEINFRTHLTSGPAVVKIGKMTSINGGAPSDFFYLKLTTPNSSSGTNDGPKYYLLAINLAEGYSFGYEKVGKEGDFIVTDVFVSNLSEGDEVIVEGHADPQKFATIEDLKDFRDALTGNPEFADGFTGTAKEAINGCTLITEFDGRVFLSGNPNLPNTVFYSQRDLTGYNNPFYIGCYNYLNDGTGRTPITAMMTTPTQLIVLKDHVAQGASIYYHYGADNPAESKVTRDLQPRIYPRENGVPGVGCLGLACNFLDDPVFLSPNGLEAIGKSQVNLERTLAHRSSYVDARLLNENLRGAVAAEWEGYLALLVPGGKLYLADGRQRYEHSLGGYQYEWYYWDGIGVYSGQKDRYHYLTQAPEVPEGVAVPEYIGDLTPAYKTIRDYVDDDITPGEVKLTYADPEDEEKTITFTFHYVVEADSAGQNDAFLVDTDGEKTGGEFQEATALLAVDGCLLFGCKDGSVCVFNTDKRGEDHYIPPEDYTRCGRRYTARCVTISDTCGRTNLAKSTIRNSLVLKTKAFPYAKVDVKVRTDVDSWEPCDTVYAGVADLDHMDFGAFSFNTYDESVAVVRERKKRWLEKQLCFEAECYESPFGIISATFDFKVAGKVKMR